MSDFRNRSKDRFYGEMSKLLKDLYVSCLDRAEKVLKPDKKSEAWKQFRFGILNLGNDKIRQLSDRLEDYTIEFRPAIFSVEYKVSVPTKKLVEFEFVGNEGDPDSVAFKVHVRDNSVIDSLVEVLGSPQVFGYDFAYWTGLYTAFHKIIPFFEAKKPFKGRTLERYIEWKEKVYKMEKEHAR